MSKEIKNITAVFTALFLLIIFSGCKKDSAFQYPVKPVVTISANDNRITGNLIHFVKDTVYVLATNIIVDSGNKFLVDAGTLIKVNPSFYISILPGAVIEVNGLKNDPVVFTSNTTKGRQGRYEYEGTWDGIRIYGNINGESSGKFSFARIEFAGVYQSALLLDKVSRATDINDIEVSYSFNNPSFEFSGGNCNAANLLSYASSGTDFLINAGYKGNLQHLLAYRHPSYINTVRNVGGIDVEDEGTLPVISNLTIMGPSLKYANNGNYLLGNPQRRAAIITAGNSRFFIRNSAVIDYPSRAYYIDSYNTCRALEIGESDVSYSVFYHADTSGAFYLPVGVYPQYVSADFKTFLLRQKYHNQLAENLGQYMLADPYNYFDGIPNPAPLAGSPLLTGANFSDSAGLYNNPFFKKVDYIGAMGADNWLTGWVNFIPLQTDYNN